MPAARLVTSEIATTRLPMCRTAIASGTVDIPTRSPPIRLTIWISAGVS